MFLGVNLSRSPRNNMGEEEMMRIRTTAISAGEMNNDLVRQSTRGPSDDVSDESGEEYKACRGG